MPDSPDTLSGDSFSLQLNYHRLKTPACSTYSCEAGVGNRSQASADTRANLDAPDNRKSIPVLLLQFLQSAK